MPRASGMQQRYGCPGRPTIGSKRKKRDLAEEILSETDPTMTGGETLGGLSSKAPPTPADEVCLVLRSATVTQRHDLCEGRGSYGFAQLNRAKLGNQRR